MLFATAGSQFFVADAPAYSPGAFPVSGWLEISGIEALGTLGGSWEMVDASSQSSVDGNGLPYLDLRKHVMQPGSMQIVFALRGDDPGQLLLWRAYRSTSLFPFRLELSSGAVRQWFGQVTAMAEVFDAANSIVKLQADILPSSAIQRSEEA